MVCNLFSPKILLLSALVIFIVLPLARGTEATHMLQKRQVGVLARTGALPQGKRSVQALARNGDFPATATHNDKRNGNNDYILDLAIQELAAAEELSRLHLQALTERLLQRQENTMGEARPIEDTEKRSVSALARAGGFPQKRSMEALTRSGYLVKPVHDNIDEEPDLLDPDDFLGKSDVELFAMNGGLNMADNKRGGLASLVKHGYYGKREGNDELDELNEYLNNEEDDDDDYFEKRNVAAAKNFLTKREIEEKEEEEKRHVGAAKDFLNSKRHIGSARNFLAYLGEGKRNLAAFKNFGSAKRNLGAAKNFILNDKRNLGSALNFMTPEKRHLGAARNHFFKSGNKKNLGSARNFLYGKRSLASFARDGGFASLKYPLSKEFDWDADEYDFDDFHEDDKRYIRPFLRVQRYLGSLGGKPYTGKRNLAATRNFGKRFEEDDDVNKRYYGSLLRQGRFYDDRNEDEDVGELTLKEKRQVAGKEGHVNGTQREKVDVTTGVQGTQQNRTKREAFFDSPSGEYPMPVLQNSRDSDYEDYIFSDGENPNNIEKRFLGSVAPIERPDSRQDLDITKRHIGALARLGWLPSFRSTRYSRSGRAIDNRIVPFRSAARCKKCTESCTLSFRRFPAEFHSWTLKQQPTLSRFPTKWARQKYRYEVHDSGHLAARVLGRIPQLGRVPQKTQTPSGRRRPQLRPNWL